MIERFVRAMLVCPACRGDLVDEPSALRCPACRLRYPIVDDVPYLVPECAVPVTEESAQ